MTDRQPHVRVEKRTVYVFGKNSVRTTKAKAYLDAARAVLREACDCSYEMETDHGHTCRFHSECTCEARQTAPDDYDIVHCARHLKLPKHKRDSVGKKAVYYVLVRDRLARFLMFVDRRSA